MAHDPSSGTPRGMTSGASRTGRESDASARLFAALQSRSGHAVVVADDAAGAEAFFERVDAQLVCQRRVRLDGAGVDPDGVIAALATDLRGTLRPRSGGAILSLVATEARAAGLPILILITGAEDAGAAMLGRLGALVESVPDARAAVRVVLLGGPRLEAVLAEPEAAPLVARVATTIHAPARAGLRWEFPLAAPRRDSSWRDAARWIVGGAAALVGASLLLAPWIRRDAGVPAAEPVTANVAAEPAPEAPTPPAAPAMPKERQAAAASAPVEPPVTPPPSAVPEPARRPPHIGQSLQVGAFRSSENARALAARLSARFPDVRVVTITRGGVALHCVRLGGFADEQELVARAAVLRTAGYASMRAPD